jgi:hypothetical protein
LFRSEVSVETFDGMPEGWKVRSLVAAVRRARPSRRRRGLRWLSRNCSGAEIWNQVPDETQLKSFFVLTKPDFAFDFELAFPRT